MPNNIANLDAVKARYDQIKTLASATDAEIDAMTVTQAKRSLRLLAKAIVFIVKNRDVL